ncbi:MAG: RnfABCDGE type electron transport complex subunit G [Fusobacteria bacterium]|jgi:electron transport complex protein RnfG|nr:RnfABCDGE type electron transport complex subunit G [Fusobacteriota bacterium]
MTRTIKYSLTLTVVAVVCAVALSYTHSFTMPYIENTSHNLEKSSREAVIGTGYTFNEEEKKVYNNLEFIPAYKNGNLDAYVVKSVTKEGYGGEIIFSMGIDLDGKIKGVKIIESKETPGLGSKINEEITINGEKKYWGNIWIGRDKDYKFNKSVDAFAGATVSPMAVYKEIIKTLNIFEKIKIDLNKGPVENSDENIPNEEGAM